MLTTVVKLHLDCCEKKKCAYFEKGTATAIRLESWNTDDGDVIQEERTGIDLNGTRQQSGKVFHIPANEIGNRHEENGSIKFMRNKRGKQ